MALEIVIDYEEGPLEGFCVSFAFSLLVCCAVSVSLTIS